MITDTDLDNSAAFAAAHWDALAYAERDMAAWENKHGRYAGCYLYRAQTYERCAESLWLEAATGEPHCVDHMMPRRTCPYGGMGIRI